MSRPAVRMPVVDRSGDLPSDDLDRALDGALATAQRVAGGYAVVGILASGRPERVRIDAGLDPAAAAVAWEIALDARDGRIPAWPGRPADGWTGFRYGLDADRTACLLVARPDLDEVTAARLEAAALDVVRAALLRGQAERTAQLDHLLATARRVAETLDLDTVLSAIVLDASTLLGADSGDMLLWDRDRDVLRVVAVSNFPPEMLGFELRFGEGVSSQAILAQRTIEVSSYRTYEHRVEALDRYDFGSVLCAPLIFRGGAIGAINVHARVAGHGFAPGAADLLAAFAGHAAIAIDHARRYENEVSLGRALAETNREITRSLNVQQALAEQVLLGAGPRGIAAVLAEHLGRRVVIEDRLHRVIAGASPDGGDDWHGLIPRREGDRRRATEPEAFSIAVRVGNDVVGHLLLSSDEDLGPIDRALVDVATTGVALEFAKERAAAEVEERLRGEAAIELLTGSYPSEDAIAARAARLGYDLGMPHDLLVIDVAAPPHGAHGAEADHDRIGRILRQVRERLAARSPRSLAIGHLGSIVVLAAVGRATTAEPRALAEDLRTCIEPLADANLITIGIGSRCTRPDDYAAAFRLAREAVDLMVKLDRRGSIVGADELGPYALLLRHTARDELIAFARRILGPLLDHDRAHGGELVTTLRAYLDEDRVQRRVAARCFIHVNTVVYRVHRIEELLGADLGDPKTVFDLTLALRIMDLLGDDPTRSAPATGRPPGAHTSALASPPSP
ncbi:MAG TPA: helix-turn-helix domain-containing protein [Candidatus Limnocylindrales bacterium]